MRAAELYLTIARAHLQLLMFYFVDVEDKTLGGELRLRSLEDAGLQQLLALGDVGGHAEQLLLQLGGLAAAHRLSQARVVLAVTFVNISASKSS